VNDPHLASGEYSSLSRAKRGGSWFNLDSSILGHQNKGKGVDRYVHFDVVEDLAEAVD
jgi:hypothetical protein